MQKAHRTQLCLSEKVIREDRLPERIKTVGGIDVSYTDHKSVGAATILDYDSLQLLEIQTAVCSPNMPYVPTLLSFRELPPAMAAIKKLHLQPDVLLVDAQGWAHPYRCGFASHLGLTIGKPTVGAAKSKLIGEQVRKDGRTLLMDRDEVVGEVVETVSGGKPIYVSVGHMVSLETAVAIVKHCSRSRIPEPLRLAHQLATKERNHLQGKAK